MMPYPDDEVVHFRELSPDDILNAVESAALRCDGRLVACNSYENRVYQVGIEEAQPMVAKFYRPGRWSDEAILEEHAFTLELTEHDIPAIAPVVDARGETLHHYGPFRFALYARHGGRAPELDNPEHLKQLGRLIARIHVVGELRTFTHRARLELGPLARESYQYLLEHDFLPPDLRIPYRTLAEQLAEQVASLATAAGPFRAIRLHGDCHPGNILAKGSAFYILDFDDARTGPAVQDLWMFLSGDRDYMNARLADILEGYTEFRDFDSRELALIEPLRTARMMQYAAWIARRWDDPAFPQAFPWFGTPRYWSDHILSLHEQSASLEEPPLVWI